MHSTESRSAVVVEELQHHVGVVSVQRRVHHSREEAVLEKTGVQKLNLVMEVGEPVILLLVESVADLSVGTDLTLHLLSKLLS
jgi:hypothetical protein